MTDWPAIIRCIQRRGRMRLIDIAAECDTCESTICDLLYRRTKEPRYTLGSNLLALHERIVPQETGNSAVDVRQSA